MFKIHSVLNTYLQINKAMFSRNYSDIFSKNKNHTGLIYVLYITLLKLTILSLFPLGVMHHEPCFHASSSTSGFLRGRIRKVSSLFFFVFIFFFSFFYIFFIFFIAPYGLSGLVWALLWVGVFSFGSSSGVKTCQAVLVIRGR